LFRWCSYCQSYMGESTPLDSYSLSHGICDDCAAKVFSSEEGLPEWTLTAKRLMDVLFSAFRNGDSLDCRRLVQEARDADIGRAEILLGLLQPALYQIGELWKMAEIDPPQEQLFSSWCEQIFLLLAADIPIIEGPEILLANMPGNLHTFGINFLWILLYDLGFNCAVAHPLATNQHLISKCIREQTKICGISVSMPGMIPSAIHLAEEIEKQTEGRTRTVLGGFAFRIGHCDLKTHIHVFAVIDNFVEYLEKAKDIKRR
jgi:methanogenic corrinoid protein MtbC1